MIKRCVINLASGRYWKGQLRLMETLNFNWGGDLLFFSEESQLNAPPHLDNPYAFKIYAFREAIRRGYNSILWLDASVYCEKNPKSVFEHIEREGYIMQEAGHLVGTWCNDHTLNYFGLTRDEAMEMTMYGNAGFLGLSTYSEKAMMFLDMWEASMKAGCFKGAWNNGNKTESNDERCKGHRHDMTCGSIIANRLGMVYQSGNEILQYKAPNDLPNNDTIIFGGQGI
jgi:hypothetical protein